MRHIRPANEFEIDTFTTVAYPGAGKGTVLEGLIHHMQQERRKNDLFEVGAMVRRHIHQGTEFGRQAVDYSGKGLLVPDEVIIPHIRESIAQLDMDSVLFLDGFPRSGGQIDAYEEEMDTYHRNHRILRLRLGRDERDERRIAEERMIKRGEEATRKRLTDKSVKVRKDDVDPVARARRLDEAAMLHDVIAHFEARGKVVTIDATKSIIDVRRSAWNAILRLLPKISRKETGAVDRD